MSHVKLYLLIAYQRVGHAGIAGHDGDGNPEPAMSWRMRDNTRMVIDH